jgi:excisionase family DNA binding protein
MASATSELLTTAEVADYLGVSRAHVYRLMSGGDLPYIAISREVRRVRKGALDDWLDRRTHGGVASTSG